MTKFIRNPIAALASALLATAPMWASAQQGVTANEIVLGEIQPLTGAASVPALGLSVGTKMAIAEANLSGGVNGRKLRLISEDDGYVVARSVQAARKLITGDRVFAITATSNSGASAAILPMLKESGIPVININSFPDSFHTPVVPNIFVAGATHQDSLEQLISQLTTRYPGKKWATVTPDDEMGSLMREGIERAHKSLNLNVVYSATYRRGQKDFSAEMLSATAAGADILIAGGIVTENIAMVKELERQGKKIPVGFSWAGRYSSAIHKMMGSAFENVYLIDYIVADESAEGRAFVARASKLLSEDDFKRVNRFSYMSYAGTRVLIEAMRRCGNAVTWSCTIKELEATQNYETAVAGRFSFSPTSHFSKQPLTLMKANPKTFNFDPLK